LILLLACSGVPFFVLGDHGGHNKDRFYILLALFLDNPEPAFPANAQQLTNTKQFFPLNGRRVSPTPN
jgi:hypothetical protein